MGILFGSCNSSPIPSPQTSPVIGEIISRDAIASTSIADGSQALFHATGGANIDNQIFTFSNGTWQNNNGEDIHINSSIETKLTALYPAYSGETLITHNPYDNDTLLDVLIAESSFIDQTNIQLNFRHLFSRLTLHIHSSIAEEIEAVKIAVPEIESIDPASGELKFLEQLYTTQVRKDETSVYSCIVPSQPNCPVKLTFVFSSGKEATHSLTHTFVSGHKYECHVNRQPGIRNVQDLIDFCNFINTNPEKGTVNTRFGEKIGDSIVYRLLADIEGCELPFPIGNKTNTPFYDTFDGQGHTISNLLIPSYDDYAGLFGHVESTGIITNLHINNASLPSSNNKFMGIIASYNNGTINNCSVSNSTIYSTTGGYIGGICSQSEGVIINCYTQNNILHVTERVYAGGIVASAENRIHNCYSLNNTFETNMSLYKIGGIVGGSTGVKTLNIRNCYTYHNQQTPEWGSAIGNPNKSSVKNFYYNKGNLYATNGIDATDSDTYKYDKNFKINSTHIVELLNNWINTTGATNYPQYTYNHWTTTNNDPPYFE